ncbi:MAG: phage head closure protein [Candidatus Obscuribacterales bacterium]|nr:phage head closure protein [Candidatus Obscuribacterales bacterium]
MQSMTAGKLDRRITFQSYKQERQRSGAAKAGQYEDFCTVWAAAKEVRSTERLLSMQMNALIDMEFWIRFRDDILKTMRIVYNERYFNIFTVEEIGRRKWLRIVGTEVNNLGTNLGVAQ